MRFWETGQSPRGWGPGRQQLWVVTAGGGPCSLHLHSSSPHHLLCGTSMPEENVLSCYCRILRRKGLELLLPHVWESLILGLGPFSVDSLRPPRCKGTTSRCDCFCKRNTNLWSSEDSSRSRINPSKHAVVKWILAADGALRELGS